MDDNAADHFILSSNNSPYMPFSFFLQFTSKTEFLSYLILCIVKMPFIPPVSITRQRSVSVPAVSGRGRIVSGTPSAVKITATKIPRDDKPSSVKDRLTSNLKQFGRKSQPRSRVPTGKSSAALRVEGRNPWLPSQRVTYTLPKSWSGGSSFLASSSGDSVPQTQRRRGGGHGFSRGSPEARDPEPERKETRFTLTLTPEAVLLLQRRSAEKYRAVRDNTNTVTLVDLTRRRRENNVAKRTPGPGPRGISVPSTQTGNNVGLPGDISSMVKISLLNDRHKYDDVEYEEEENALDERVVLKCTEWLRGLESAPVALCTMDKSASLKGF